MKRWEIINKLIDKHDYKTYLEIGCAKNECFKKVKAKYKVGVDPIEGGNVRATSDQYFEGYTPVYFDIILIDGLHLSEQVYKDIKNAVKRLNSNGIIICHDMLPQNSVRAQRQRETIAWNGDCFACWFWLLAEKDFVDNYDMKIIDTDHGLGVIHKGQTEQISIPETVDYKYYENNKDKMNIISEKNFVRWYLK